MIAQIENDLATRIVTNENANVKPTAEGSAITTIPVIQKDDVRARAHEMLMNAHVGTGMITTNPNAIDPNVAIPTTDECAMRGVSAVLPVDAILRPTMMSRVATAAEGLPAPKQREMRSIFVSQLSARVGDRELGIFFENQAGKVREARVIVDRISRRSKGVGYVEFVELETVQKALTLSGTKLLGIPIAVQYTEAEKNRQAREPGAVAAGNAPPGGAPATQGQAPPNHDMTRVNRSTLLNRLYVGSLNFALTDEDVRQVFQSFGEITRVDLHRDAITNKSKGYAFVQFKEIAHAQEALEKMNNFVLAGREIKVGLVGDRTMSANRGETQLQQEDGPSLNNISRIELMQKLARSDQPEEMDALKTSVPRPIIPTATTRNVVMANAFNPEEETEPDWDVELRDDVKEECQNSYGPILDIYVLKESKGEIYIRFGAVQDAIKAVAGLNGRFFGGNQITASHTSDQLFDAKK
ncbi:BQ5605_C013g07322 [Microbotryum silenes-dioicae]|uniref:BQ5605_C013g07322 protein n=1 Tax=Microbotryum silenes-dioicae TaxID=796604 RepID=A0A2X0LRG8_9BASI|nr:BQ5605_C013g07322 [Microbotryum silenes-dioicae]